MQHSSNPGYGTITTYIDTIPIATTASYQIYVMYNGTEIPVTANATITILPSSMISALRSYVTGDGVGAMQVGAQ